MLNRQPMFQTPTRLSSGAQKASTLWPRVLNPFPCSLSLPLLSPSLSPSLPLPLPLPLSLSGSRRTHVHGGASRSTSVKSGKTPKRERGREGHRATRYQVNCQQLVYWCSLSNPRTKCIHCDNCLVIKKKCVLSFSPRSSHAIKRKRWPVRKLLQRKRARTCTVPIYPCSPPPPAWPCLQASLCTPSSQNNDQPRRCIGSAP